MIRFNCLDRLVDFSHFVFPLFELVDFDKNYKEWTTEIRVVLSTNDKKIIKKAQKIDKEYFNKKCFGIAFNYVHNESKMYLLGNGFYYVDNGGDENYIQIDKDIIKRLQNKTEIEYKKYLENEKEYLDTHKYLLVEEI